MMHLSGYDEKELQRIVDEIDAITRNLREFRQRSGNIDGIQVTTEYLTLHKRFNELRKEIESIP
jgi:hypothetical protein